MEEQTVLVPDIGADSAEVIELLVAVGDEVAPEQGLIVIESDKASMEVPADSGGKVARIHVQVGDEVSEGAAVVTLAGAEPAVAVDAEPAEPAKDTKEQTQAAEAPVTPEPESAPAPAQASSERTVVVPDIGTEDAVEIIEISVAVGDALEEGDTLVVLESDKASMEVPAPWPGTVVNLLVSQGDSVRMGDALLVALTGADDRPSAPSAEPEAVAPTEPSPLPVTPGKPVKNAVTAEPPPASDGSETNGSASIYAGPAVRKLAREFGIDLAQVAGSGPRGRLQKEDLHQYVKKSLATPPTATGGGGAIPAVPQPDYAVFGDIEIKPLAKIDKVTAANMHRSWLNVPRVTQFDDADITDLEKFRTDLKSEAERRGVKLTPMPFLIKACAAALRNHPKMTASLVSEREEIVYKQYCNIGMAVDTPAGLVVPVIRDADKKSVWDLAAEVVELANLARDRKLKPADMQGACFTISSLGNIGGTGFTPIVNAPEVAILGVSRASIQPVWDGSSFQPRKMLPLSLSYDHRVVNGGDGGRFMTELVALLGDIRRMVL